MIFHRLAAAAALFSAALAAGPEQIHLSYTGRLGHLSVDFVCASGGAGSVTFTVDNTTWVQVNATFFNYPSIGDLQQALISPAWEPTPGAALSYFCACADGSRSDVFDVTPVPARYPSEVHVVFGDFGLLNDVSMAPLIADATGGVYDSVLHVGDWAYNFEDSQSAVGSQFMNDIQSYAAIHPVMPVAGNHEACGLCAGADALPLSENNFTEYRTRFHAVTLNAGANSGSGNNLFYSFSQGLTHFVVFSAEAYAHSQSAAFLANQIAFMKSDLAAVDRSKTPWVVGLVHRDWLMLPEAFLFFGPVLEDAGVDVMFCGHVHYYNRYVPFNMVSLQADEASVSKDKATYTNPKYMITIVTGASGDREGDDKCSGVDLVISAACSQNYGYGFFTAVNASHATWSFKTVQADGPGPANFSDSLTIVQANHGPRA